MEFYDVLEKRQSVRGFKPDPVPDDVLNRILEAFRAAPSWANTQPWELILITEPDIRKQLQQTLSPNNPATAAMVIAPLLIGIIGITGLSGFYRGHPSTNRGDWVMFDTGIATEHLVLAAAAEGLGTVHVGAFDFATADKILQMPKNRTVIEFIPLGYPAYSPRKVPRKPLADFLYRNKYGQK
jgi:nitroreductase